MICERYWPAGAVPPARWWPAGAAMPSGAGRLPPAGWTPPGGFCVAGSRAPGLPSKTEIPFSTVDTPFRGASLLANFSVLPSFLAYD